jgi:hypothetical protein
MSHEDLVWSFQPLKELNNETGFVACDHELAASLIEAGKVQDPRVGALHLKEIQEAEVEVKAAPKKKQAKDTEGDK